jgi:hypothetical protein
MMPSNKQISLLELLLEKGAITRSSMELMTDFCKRWQVEAYDAVIESNILTEGELSSILAEYFSIDRYLEIEEDDIKDELTKVLKFSDAKRYCCLPVAYADDEKTLKVVIADPTNYTKVNAIKDCMQKNIVLSVANQTAIIRKIHEVYSPETQLSSVWEA